MKGRGLLIDRTYESIKSLQSKVSVKIEVITNNNSNSVIWKLSNQWYLMVKLSQRTIAFCSHVYVFLNTQHSASETQYT